MKRFLCMLLVLLLCASALAETVQDQALAFIQAAGIGTDSVTRVDNEILVNLAGGGTAHLYSYGDFDPYDLSWRFEGASDADVALYLDHALGLLAGLEEQIPAASEARARDFAVIVSNSLLYLENTGEQGLRVLLSQLERHEESPLNSLRARLASRLLGHLDATPVDPSEGLAWYDALTLSVQDDLPTADASTYVADPFMARVTQLMIAREEARRADYSWGNDVDPARTGTFVYLSSEVYQKTDSHAVVWCHMASETYALYDGSRAVSLSGGWYPVRIDLEQTAEGWAIVQVTEPEDGTRYASSIQAFCDGDKALARTLIAANTPELHQAHRDALMRCFAAAGYPDVVLD